MFRDLRPDPGQVLRPGRSASRFHDGDEAHVDVLASTSLVAVHGEDVLAAGTETGASLVRDGHLLVLGPVILGTSQLRGLLTATYEIQAGVTSREAPARDLVEHAERLMLEVAHDDRQKKIRSIERRPPGGDRQAPPAVDVEDGPHRARRRASRTSTRDRPISGREPGHACGQAIDGEDRARTEHRGTRGLVRAGVGSSPWR